MNSATTIKEINKEIKDLIYKVKDFDQRCFLEYMNLLERQCRFKDPHLLFTYKTDAMRYYRENVRFNDSHRKLSKIYRDFQIQEDFYRNLTAYVYNKQGEEGFDNLSIAMENLKICLDRLFDDNSLTPTDTINIANWCNMTIKGLLKATRAWDCLL